MNLMIIRKLDHDSVINFFLYKKDGGFVMQ